MKVLNREQEIEVARSVVELREELGVTVEEFIPGATTAIRLLASTLRAEDEQQALDEIVNMLEEE